MSYLIVTLHIAGDNFEQMRREVDILITLAGVHVFKASLSTSEWKFSKLFRVATMAGYGGLSSSFGMEVGA